MKYLALLAVLLIAQLFAEEPANLTTVWTKAEGRPVDKRHERPRTLYQGSGFVPPTDKAAWQERTARLREQILVAAGIWPVPTKSERCPLDAVIHGKVERDGYSVEKVYFQSYPGFYVSGNLYRPLGKAGPFPGVLCPHGHWNNGRFYEAPEKDVKKQIDGGWETDPDAARYPLQARSANMAKLGCVVFFYDMVGYADSDPKRFPHRATWLGAREEMESIGVLGLQLWDSIRALDFLETLPDVDKTRLACTGASGGATQTFLLMATDSRLACAAPVCMISAGDHQGGCVCENTALLRVFTDNVEIAACFAPKPFIHPTATGDWTKEFMEKGYPEIKAVYKLFNAEDNFAAMRQKADHNYNKIAREAVYNFFNKHLKLGQPEPVVEQKFQPLKPAELSVFDATHPRPESAVDAPALRKYLAERTTARLSALPPGALPGVLQPVLRVLLGNPSDRREIDGLVHVDAKGFHMEKHSLSPPLTEKEFHLGHPNRELVPAVGFFPTNSKGARIDAVVLPGGKAALLNADGSPGELLAGILANTHAAVSADLFGEDENAGPKASDHSKEFFAGYNVTVIGNRARDVRALCTGIGEGASTLIALGKDGPACVLAAAALSPGKLKRVIVDADNFDFDQVKDYNDERFLPGAVRFGGLWTFAALIAPAELHVYNAGREDVPPLLKAAYAAAGASDKLHWHGKAPPPDAKGILELLK